MFRTALSTTTLVALCLLFSLGNSVPRSQAAPVLDRIETEVKRGRTLKVNVHATFDGPGRVRIEGVVNGQPVLIEKRVRQAGTKRWRFRLRTRRYGQRRPTADVRFDLQAKLEDATGTQVEQTISATIPVPLIVLPGLGNEVPELHPTGPALAAFATQLDVSRGAAYTLDGKRQDLVVLGYPSLEATLPDLATELHKTARKLLRGSPFRKVDVVGYSMGGLVARTWGADKGSGRVRRMVFMGTPHEGTPLAYFAAQLSSGQLNGLLGDQPGGNEALQFLQLLGGAETQQTLRIFYPTYPWVGGLFGGASNPVQDQAVLTALNARPPDPDAAYHSIAYSAGPGQDQGVPFGTLETLDALTLAALVTGGGLDSLDPLTLLDGEGDLIVPLRSAFLQDVPAWAAVLQTYDAGAGSHVNYPLDPNVVARVASILARP